MFRTRTLLLAILFSKHAYSQNSIESIAIDLIVNLIFVGVIINGHDRPLHFLFDTGAGITLINSKVSNEIKLKISDTISIGTAGKTIRSGCTNKINI